LAIEIVFNSIILPSEFPAVTSVTAAGFVVLPVNSTLNRPLFLSGLLGLSEGDVRASGGPLAEPQLG